MTFLFQNLHRIWIGQSCKLCVTACRFLSLLGISSTFNEDFLCMYVCMLFDRKAVATFISLEELTKHVDFIRSCTTSTASAARHRTGHIHTYIHKIFHINKNLILIHFVSFIWSLTEVGQGTLLTATGEFLLPLLTLPKSLDPFLTILLHGRLTVYRYCIHMPLY